MMKKMSILGNGVLGMKRTVITLVMAVVVASSLAACSKTSRKQFVRGMNDGISSSNRGSDYSYRKRNRRIIEDNPVRCERVWTRKYGFMRVCDE